MVDGVVGGKELDMGRMSDYDIRPKPKVWACSPNECRTFGRTSAECCMLG